MAKSTADILSSPQFSLKQPEKGYRFSIDSFILASHINCVSPDSHLIDIGCGCGIISILLAVKFDTLQLTGVEIQKELSECALQNIQSLGLNSRIAIINADITETVPGRIGGQADIIVSNPPYKKQGTGRLNPDSGKAAARHEIHLDIQRLFKCADRLLNPEGLVYLIFPSDRLDDLTDSMNRYGFNCRFKRFVHQNPDTGAWRVIVCAQKRTNYNSRIIPPFYITDENKKYTAEYLSLFTLKSLILTHPQKDTILP